MVYYLSKGKKEKLEKELYKLVNEGRKEIANKLDFAKALGDLKENAEYHTARDEQGKMESRIKELDIILKESVIVKPKKNGKIQIGSKIKLIKNNSNDLFYEIVGRQEVDIFNGKIAIDAPLTKEMLGKEEGQEFEFTTPAGIQNKYKILKIF